MFYAIICLDDDPLILKMLELQLRRIVQSEKVIFEFFTNPDIAINEISLMSEKSVQPLLLVTDYRMPEKDGARVVRELKQFNSGIHCVILSGEANAIQVDDLVNDDLLAAFVHKPWNEEELAAVVLPVLDQMNII
jgi:CheY-like chemotaxis protein